MKKKIILALLLVLFSFIFLNNLNVYAENSISNESINIEENTKTTDDNKIFDNYLLLCLSPLIILVLPILLFILEMLDFDICDIGYFLEDIIDFIIDKFNRLKNGQTFDEYKNSICSKELTDEYVYATILKSNKIINKKDEKYLNSFVFEKENWKTLKEDIVEHNENEENFIRLFLDALNHIDLIEKYFSKEKVFDTTTCLTSIGLTIDKLLNNRSSYIHIDKHYFLTEIAVYVLSLKDLNIKELYDFFDIPNGYERINISCVIANLVEAELAFQKSLTVSDTIGEAVALLNNEYNLNLSEEFSYNLIHLSKASFNNKLYKLIFNTNLLYNMSNFRSFKYNLS